MLLGAIEAGGTKFVCAVGTAELEIRERVSFPTTTPVETLVLVADFFENYQSELAAIGVGSFGPIDLQSASETYGWITSTPKLAWQNFDFVGALTEDVADLPIAWTTDVNAACYGEYTAGRGQGLDSVVYYTIGTGVGGGAVQNGRLLSGFSHPEMGHMLLQRHPQDHFNGSCPFHQNCLEGLAAGPAIQQRTGQLGIMLAADDPSWELEAAYLAQCVYNTTLLLSPERIILGGGVMKQTHLLPRIRQQFQTLFNGYTAVPEISEYIVTPQLGDDAGTIGCLALAKELLDRVKADVK